MGLGTTFDNQSVNDYSQLDDIINTLSDYQKSITKLNKKLASTYKKVNKLQATTINKPQRKTPNLVTLTAPDGHRERWDYQTTYTALKLWSAYLNDPDEKHISIKSRSKKMDLAKRIAPFVGDDPKQVDNLLVYLDGFQDDLYSKLSLLTHNSTASTVKLYFIMKSIDNPDYLPHNYQKEAQREAIIKRINRVTNGDPKLLARLTKLCKLFVDGFLKYQQ